MKTLNLAIMFTDIVGFTESTARQSRDENAALIARHDEILLPLVQAFGGEHVKSIGDALLCVFPSPTNAVLAAMAMQDALFAHNLTVEEDDKIEITIGINVGEVRRSRGDVFGDAVNIASRIQGMTPPNEIYFSDAVYMSMNKAEVPAESAGKHELKGVPIPMHFWKVPRFATPRLVAEKEDSTEDIADIAYPYGGAHTKLPSEGSIIHQLFRFEQKHFIAVGAFIIVALVLFPRFIHSPSISTPDQQERVGEVPELAAARATFDELDERRTSILRKIARHRQKAADSRSDDSLSRDEQNHLRKQAEMRAKELQSYLESFREQILNTSAFQDARAVLERESGKKAAGGGVDGAALAAATRTFSKFVPVRDALDAAFDMRIAFHHELLNLEQEGSYQARRLVPAMLAADLERDASRRHREKNYKQSASLYQKATDLIREAIELEKSIKELKGQGLQDNAALEQAAQSAAEKQDVKREIVIRNAILRIASGQVDNHQRLADLYAESEQAHHAILVLDKFVRRKEPYLAHMRIAQLHTDLEDYEAAAKAYRYGLREADGLEQKGAALLSYAESLARNGKFKNATRELERFLRRNEKLAGVSVRGKPLQETLEAHLTAYKAGQLPG